MKTILSGWFIIKAMTDTGTGQLYELVEPIHNYYVSLETSTSLPYGPDHWIKLNMNATCDDTIETDSDAPIPILRSAHFCTADSFVELKCTERNSLVINGIRFC